MYFLAGLWKSGLIGTPDLSLPPVIFNFPDKPTIEASVSEPTCNPSSEFASVSFNSFVIDFPLASDTVNLKFAKDLKKMWTTN